jgi:enoyl-CoA hydratase/carnithine racemase
MMEFILSHVEKGVMTLTLNRPERLNSFNDEMHTQLAECLKQVERRHYPLLVNYRCRTWILCWSGS